ncbi:MAG: hypothetical protein J3K34DRAFT_409489 [Monoraphidium minutum]|nr:MAG: hypothetical protein J3K34DRAFT_409489 [Monoraphidium minutum]
MGVCWKAARLKQTVPDSGQSRTAPVGRAQRACRAPAGGAVGQLSHRAEAYAAAIPASTLRRRARPAASTPVAAARSRPRGGAAPCAVVLEGRAQVAPALRARPPLGEGGSPESLAATGCGRRPPRRGPPTPNQGSDAGRGDRAAAGRAPRHAEGGQATEMLVSPRSCTRAGRGAATDPATATPSAGIPVTAGTACDTSTQQ